MLQPLPIFISAICIFSFILVVYSNISPRQCRHHKWPKIKTPQKRKNDKSELVSTGKWIETDKDEWLRCPFSCRPFRRCPRCGTTEYILLRDDGNPFTAIYNSNGRRVGERSDNGTF